jgi:hypothetical protein
MRQSLIFLLMLMIPVAPSGAQTAIIDVTAGNGNGLRFWSNDAYKIHMGNLSEYKFGPVNDYSIKMNMSGGINGRGWTWGVAGQTPVAALNILGQMEIAGHFAARSVNIFGGSPASVNLVFGANYNDRFRWRVRTTDRGNAIDMDFTASDNSDTEEAVLRLTHSSSGRPEFQLNNDAIVSNDGRVGIGTANPQHRLHVNGTVYSTEVRVDVAAGSGPDYVFLDNYPLPSLEEVKTHINAYKHLPGVPSAKEMEANGIQLGEMNLLLLKKIEELTLYILSLQTQLNSQQTEINLLKEKK